MKNNEDLEILNNAFCELKAAVKESFPYKILIFVLEFLEKIIEKIEENKWGN